MDFIDYLTLMLINMSAGLLILGCFLWKDIEQPQRQHWAPAFAIPGAIAAICGFVMTFTWPLPGPYNIMYGEMSILLGLLWLGTSWSLAKGWNLWPLGLYALPAGIAAVLLGIRILNMGLTNSPILSGAGFILTGLGGVFALPALSLPGKILWLRRIGALMMLAASLIWAWIGYFAYWAHIQAAA